MSAICHLNKARQCFGAAGDPTTEERVDEVSLLTEDIIQEVFYRGDND